MGPKIGVEIELRRQNRSSQLRKQQKISELRDKIGAKITLCFDQESELSSISTTILGLLKLSTPDLLFRKRATAIIGTPDSLDARHAPWVTRSTRVSFTREVRDTSQVDRETTLAAESYKSSTQRARLSVCVQSRGKSLSASRYPTRKEPPLSTRRLQARGLQARVAMQDERVVDFLNGNQEM